MKHLLSLAAIMALASAVPARATIYYTFDESVFYAATHNQGIDTFNDLVALAPLPSRTRTAGSYTYEVDSPVEPYGWGTSSDPTIAPRYRGDPLIFSNFTGGANAIGGYFYDTVNQYTYYAGDLGLVATDASETLAISLENAMQNSFVGFFSDTGILSLRVRSQTDYTTPTVNNLVLARTGTDPVVNAPEPAAWTLALTGMLGLAGIGRRRAGRG